MTCCMKCYIAWIAGGVCAWMYGKHKAGNERG